MRKISLFFYRNNIILGFTAYGFRETYKITKAIGNVKLKQVRIGTKLKRV